MTTAPTLAGGRAERRSRLLDLIARATEELITLERADRRATRLADTIVEPVPAALRLTEGATIRAWAAANGHTVNDRGPIPKDVRTAYNAAHPQDPTP